MSNLFDKLDRRRAPVAEQLQQHPQQQAAILLGWVARWPKPVLTLTDVRNFGPRAVRKKEIAIRSAQILAAHGHLTTLAAHKWKIVREPLIPPISR